MLQAIMDSAREFVQGCPENRVQAEDAMHADLVGLQLFDEPIFAVGDAGDPLFLRLKEPEVIHPAVMLPADWLGNARRIIAYFLPFTGAVKTANGSDLHVPADEWLHGRIEGQMLIDQLGRHICTLLKEAGCAAVCPSCDPRIQMLTPLICNWSERHAAYICGLGTFSLSKGLITSKGVAGRLGSVITDGDLPVTSRPYTSLYEYCSLCSTCAENCPVCAIDESRGMDHAKDHLRCKAFLDHIQSLPPRGESRRVRFACGKCQVQTPCQDGIPT